MNTGAMLEIPVYAHGGTYRIVGSDDRIYALLRQLEAVDRVRDNLDLYLAREARVDAFEHTIDDFDGEKR